MQRGGAGEVDRRAIVDEIAVAARSAIAQSQTRVAAGRGDVGIDLDVAASQKRQCAIVGPSDGIINDDIAVASIGYQVDAGTRHRAARSQRQVSAGVG